MVLDDLKYDRLTQVDRELAIEARLLPRVSRKQLGGIMLCATEGCSDKCTYPQFEEILVRSAQLFSGHPMSTPEQLSSALVELLAHIDGTPALATVISNIGNTHSGGLRLVPEPSRRPWIKKQRSQVQGLHTSLLRLSAAGAMNCCLRSN